MLERRTFGLKEVLGQGVGLRGEVIESVGDLHEEMKSTIVFVCVMVQPSQGGV